MYAGQAYGSIEYAGYLNETVVTIHYSPKPKAFEKTILKLEYHDFKQPAWEEIYA